MLEAAQHVRVCCPTARAYTHAHHPQTPTFACSPDSEDERECCEAPAPPPPPPPPPSSCSELERCTVVLAKDVWLSKEAVAGKAADSGGPIRPLPRSVRRPLPVCARVRGGGGRRSRPWLLHSPGSRAAQASYLNVTAAGVSKHHMHAGRHAHGEARGQHARTHTPGPGASETP